MPFRAADSVGVKRGIPELVAAVGPVQLDAVPNAGQEMADTSHAVEVRFVNAPAGMRSGITQADGPARLALRTNYAMAAPF